MKTYRVKEPFLNYPVGDGYALPTLDRIDIFILKKLGVIEEVKEDFMSMKTVQDYYYINTFFEVAKKVWSGLSDDRHRIGVGNCFSTSEAAEQARGRVIKALKNKE